MEIDTGYCKCGCGSLTNLAPRNNPRKGWVKGMPVRYIAGHQSRKRYVGSASPLWKGGRLENRSRGGYVRIWMPNHPNADSVGYVLESHLIAEKALGKPLPPKAIVHHHTPIDLVICENQAYHMFLHQRTRALEACGNADWKKCRFCKQYDDPGNMKQHGTKNTFWHRDCKNAYDRAKRREAR